MCHNIINADYMSLLNFINFYCNMTFFIFLLLDF